jgi:hypothetical protein
MIKMDDEYHQLECINVPSPDRAHQGEMESNSFELMLTLQMLFDAGHRSTNLVICFALSMTSTEWVDANHCTTIVLGSAEEHSMVFQRIRVTRMMWENVSIDGIGDDDRCPNGQGG